MTGHSCQSKAQSPTTADRTCPGFSPDTSASEKWKFRNKAARFQTTLKTCSCAHRDQQLVQRRLVAWWHVYGRVPEGPSYKSGPALF